MAFAYLAAWALSPLVMRGTRTDLDYFFWPAAQYAGHGHALSVYSFQTGDSYPDANGPLSLLALAPLAAIASAFGWTDPRVAAGMTGVVAALLAMLIAREALRLVAMVRGTVEWRIAATCGYLIAPVLWIAVAGFGHLEQVIETYLLLLAVRALLAGQQVRAGAAFGLALLTRTAALACAVPLALVAACRGGRRAVLSLGTATVVVAAAGIAPFLVADGGAVIHSLVGYRGALPIGGGSVWVALYRSPLATVVEHGDAYLSLAVGALLCGLLVRRRPELARGAGGIFGLLCIAATCFPMLAKTVHSYYLFEPYVFATTWWLARPGSALNWRLAAPALLTVDVFLTEWSVTLPLSGLGVVEGIASSVMLAAVIAIVALDLVRGELPSRRLLPRGVAA